MNQNNDGSIGVNVNLNQEQQKQATAFGINALKKNMTKDNMKSAASFAANNTKLVGSMAMSAFSNMTKKKEEPKPQEKPKEDDFFSNFANFKI